MLEAKRTLVKSIPELWADVSDPDCLARHLGAFEAIRITDVQPEQRVVWEGEHGAGEVQLESAGFGTRVRLVARRHLARPATATRDRHQAGRNRD